MTAWACIKKRGSSTSTHTRTNTRTRETIVTLPHPQTGHGVRFVLVEEESAVTCGEFVAVRLLQVERIAPRGLYSWFMGDSVQRDGSLHVMAPVDPLLVVLPLLDRACAGSSKFVPLDAALFDEAYPAVSRLLGLLDTLVARLDKLCDTQELAGGDAVLYRLNHDKTMALLKSKVDKLVANFDKVQLFEQLPATQTSTETQRAATACKFIGEWLDDKWLAALEEAMGVTGSAEASESQNVDPALATATSTVTSADGTVTLDIDYAVTTRITNRENVGSSKAGAGASGVKRKLSQGQRKLDKADKSGMKSIASFFKK